MSEKQATRLKEQMSRGQILVPYVFDCMSARLAENSGFETFAFSTSGFALSGLALPDMGILNSEDVIMAAARVIDFLPYPLIVELENGFGETPFMIWHTVRRMVSMNPAAIIIDDTTAIRGRSRELYNGKANEVLSEEAFYGKIRAAVNACQGNDCLVVAASNAQGSLGLAESTKRLKKCVELGADITMCRGIKGIGDCKEIAAQVDGPKVYDEFSTTDGKPDVDLDEIAKLGFRLVTIRYTEKASIWGLMKLCLPCGRDRSLVYNDYHDYDGMLPGLDHHIRFSTRRREFGKKISETTDAKLADK